MGFVGFFVRTEPRIPVNPISTVLHRKPSDRRIESGDRVDQPGDQTVEPGLYVAVPKLVRFEPFPVVMAPQLFQKPYDIFHAYPN